MVRPTKGKSEKKKVIQSTNINLNENVKIKEPLKQDKAELYLKIAGTMFIAIDSAGKVTLANDKASEILGLPVDEIVGKDWFDNFIPERLRADVKAVSKKILDGDLQPVSSFENPVLRSDGEERLICWESTHLRDDASNIIGTLSSGMDITERKKAEELQRVLLDIANSINTCEKLDDIYPIIHSNLSRILETTNFFIAFYNKDSHTLSFPYYVDEQDEYEVVSAEKTNSHYIIRTGEALLADREVFADLNSRGEIVTREELGRPLIWLGAPLKLGDEVFGVVAVQSYTNPKAYNENDKEILQLVSHQIANAIVEVKAEEALKESEEKYRTLIQNTPEIVQSVALDGKFLFVNKTWHDLLGYSEEELKRLTLFDIIHPDSLEHCSQLFNEAISGNLLTQIGAKFKTKYGSTIYVEGNAVPHYLEGRLIGTLGFFLDITKRKKAEDAIIESEQKFRQLAENIDHVFWLTDWKNKKLLYVSPAYEKVFGKSIESIYEDRLSWKTVVHPDDLEMVEKTFEEHADIGEYFEIDYRIICNGTVKWIHEFAFPVKDENGEINRFINVAEDITVRKHHEVEIENLNSFLLVIRNLNQAIVRLDDFDRLLDEACKVMLEIRGYIDVSIAFYDPLKDAIVPRAHLGEHKPASWVYTPETGGDAPSCVKKAIAKRYALILDPGQCHDCAFCRHDSEHQSIIVPMLNQDGESMGVIIACIESDQYIHRVEVPLFEEIAGDLVFAYNKITADNELLHLTENLQELVDEKTGELEVVHTSLMKQERLAVLGQMAASVSHELRNPLTVINSVSYYLKTKFPDMDEKTFKMLDLLESEVERSDRIIGNMLGFSKQKPNILEDVDMNTIVSQFFSRTERIPGNVKVDLKLHKIVPVIQADVEKLNQVLGNLISNACHAMSLDGGTLTVTTGINDNFVNLSVKDTGQGMSEEIQSRIFEPLFSTKTTGFGLGLPIVKTLVKDHGGEIKVKSKEGKGTEFIIRLPVEGRSA
ncbi:MAG: PAS domain S-box protein [Thermoplasmata archaeon]|nr:PAS domain S-box protein [Thermoplasmata archaeon]